MKGMLNPGFLNLIKYIALTFFSLLFMFVLCVYVHAHAHTPIYQGRQMKVTRQLDWVDSDSLFQVDPRIEIMFSGLAMSAFTCWANMTSCKKMMLIL